jgi:hypothetical protein
MQAADLVLPTPIVLTRTMHPGRRGVRICQHVAAHGVKRQGRSARLTPGQPDQRNSALQLLVDATVARLSKAYAYLTCGGLPACATGIGSPAARDLVVTCGGDGPGPRA